MTYDLETIELMLKALSSTFGQEGTRLTDTDWSFVKKSPTIISELVEEVKRLREIEKDYNEMESLKAARMTAAYKKLLGE